VALLTPLVARLRLGPARSIHSRRAYLAFSHVPNLRLGLPRGLSRCALCRRHRLLFVGRRAFPPPRLPPPPSPHPPPPSPLQPLPQRLPPGGLNAPGRGARRGHPGGDCFAPPALAGDAVDPDGHAALHPRAREALDKALAADALAPGLGFPGLDHRAPAGPNAPPRLGWLLSTAEHTLRDAGTGRAVSCLACSFVGEDGRAFRALVRHAPSLLVVPRGSEKHPPAPVPADAPAGTVPEAACRLQARREAALEQALRRRYQGAAGLVACEPVWRDDLGLKNHLGRRGPRRRLLKLTFEHTSGAQEARADLLRAAARAERRARRGWGLGGATGGGRGGDSAGGGGAGGGAAGGHLAGALAGAPLGADDDDGGPAEPRPDRDGGGPLADVAALREHDLPYPARVAIDLGLRCGQWYDVRPAGAAQDPAPPQPRTCLPPTPRPDRVVPADPVVLAFDLETTKLPLQFPNATFDQIFMISYMVDGRGFLLCSREVVGGPGAPDVADFDYTPLPRFPGPFTVKTLDNEKEVIREFFRHVREEVKPHVWVTYNGDWFDWPFLANRAAAHGLDLRAATGFEPPQKRRGGGDQEDDEGGDEDGKDGGDKDAGKDLTKATAGGPDADGQPRAPHPLHAPGDWLSRCGPLHLDCMHWVNRDSYLPQGSRGLKAVTQAKLGYQPVEVPPEDMLRRARDDPQGMASYSVSDAVATYYLYKRQVQTMIFGLCTILPLAPDDTLRRGSGTLCEMLLLVRAHEAGVVAPDKQRGVAWGDRWTADGRRLLESETYVGGKVEAVEAGVFRADLDYDWRVDPGGYSDLLAGLDDDLRHAVEVEGGAGEGALAEGRGGESYNKMRAEIVAGLTSLRDRPVRRERPLVYHLDVSAMYPNIILTDRLQPSAVVDAAACAACDHNVPGPDGGPPSCLRKMDWVWRGEAYAAGRAEIGALRAQLEAEPVPGREVLRARAADRSNGGDGRPGRGGDLDIDPDGPASFLDLPQAERDARLKTRLKNFCQKVYKRVLDRPWEETRTAGVCMREDSFYVDTVRAFRDRRYVYKRETKEWAAEQRKAADAGDGPREREAGARSALAESLQLAHKAILNSFYGYVMRRGARWASMEMAGVVTHRGARIISDAADVLRRLGRPLELDTDGVWVALPASFPTDFVVDIAPPADAPKDAKPKRVRVSYPTAVLNRLTADRSRNDQYLTAVRDPADPTGRRILRHDRSTEQSIEFELDGPYAAMVLPASREEGRNIKKRYAVFALDGTLSEVKGFELKRRGELQLVKAFQQELFGPGTPFLKGGDLAGCYAAAGACAARWLELLDRRGAGVPDDELLGLLSESATMSRALEDYGGRRSCAITTATRLAAFLGDERVKDRGLRAEYIVSRFPAGATPTDRCVPAAVFATGVPVPVARAWLGRWCRWRPPGAADSPPDPRDLIDWSYYRERLANAIQKIVTVPAALQGLPNPVPSVPHPDWLRRKVAERDDPARQLSLMAAWGRKRPALTGVEGAGDEAMKRARGRDDDGNVGGEGEGEGDVAATGAGRVSPADGGTPVPVRSAWGGDIEDVGAGGGTGAAAARRTLRLAATGVAASAADSTHRAAALAVAPAPPPSPSIVSPALRGTNYRRWLAVRARPAWLAEIRARRAAAERRRRLVSARATELALADHDRAEGSARHRRAADRARADARAGFPDSLSRLGPDPFALGGLGSALGGADGGGARGRGAGATSLDVGAALRRRARDAAAGALDVVAVEPTRRPGRFAVWCLQPRQVPGAAGGPGEARAAALHRLVIAAPRTLAVPCSGGVQGAAEVASRLACAAASVGLGVAVGGVLAAAAASWRLPPGSLRLARPPAGVNAPPPPKVGKDGWRPNPRWAGEELRLALGADPICRPGHGDGVGGAPFVAAVVSLPWIAAGIAGGVPATVAVADSNADADADDGTPPRALSCALPEAWVRSAAGAAALGSALNRAPCLGGAFGLGRPLGPSLALALGSRLRLSRAALDAGATFDGPPGGGAFAFPGDIVPVAAPGASPAALAPGSDSALEGGAAGKGKREDARVDSMRPFLGPETAAGASEVGEPAAARAASVTADALAAGGLSHVAVMARRGPGGACCVVVHHPRAGGPGGMLEAFVSRGATAAPALRGAAARAAAMGGDEARPPSAAALASMWGPRVVDTAGVGAVNAAVVAEAAVADSAAVTAAAAMATVETAACADVAGAREDAAPSGLEDSSSSESDDEDDDNEVAVDVTTGATPPRRARRRFVGPCPVAAPAAECGDEPAALAAAAAAVARLRARAPGPTLVCLQAWPPSLEACLRGALAASGALEGAPCARVATRSSAVATMADDAVGVAGRPDDGFGSSDSDDGDDGDADGARDPLPALGWRRAALRLLVSRARRLPRRLTAAAGRAGRAGLSLAAAAGGGLAGAAAADPTGGFESGGGAPPLPPLLAIADACFRRLLDRAGHAPWGGADGGADAAPGGAGNDTGAADDAVLAALDAGAAPPPLLVPAPLAAEPPAGPAGLAEAADLDTRLAAALGPSAGEGGAAPGDPEPSRPAAPLLSAPPARPPLLLRPGVFRGPCVELGVGHLGLSALLRGEALDARDGPTGAAARVGAALAALRGAAALWQAEADLVCPEEKEVPVSGVGAPNGRAVARATRARADAEAARGRRALGAALVAALPAWLSHPSSTASEPALAAAVQADAGRVLERLLSALGRLGARPVSLGPPLLGGLDDVGGGNGADGGLPAVPADSGLRLVLSFDNCRGPEEALARVRFLLGAVGRDEPDAAWLSLPVLRCWHSLVLLDSEAWLGLRWTPGGDSEEEEEEEEGEEGEDAGRRRAGSGGSRPRPARLPPLDGAWGPADYLPRGARRLFYAAAADFVAAPWRAGYGSNGSAPAPADPPTAAADEAARLIVERWTPRALDAVARIDRATGGRGRLPPTDPATPEGDLDWPRRVGPGLRGLAPAAAYAQTLSGLYSLDVRVAEDAANLYRTLLRRLGADEWARPELAAPRDPRATLVVEGVGCPRCGLKRSTDAAREPRWGEVSAGAAAELFGDDDDDDARAAARRGGRRGWACPAAGCGAPANRGAVEARLIDALGALRREAAAQDLVCVRCGLGAARRLDARCGCGGALGPARLGARGLLRRLGTFADVAAHHGLETVGEIARWAMGEIYEGT